MKSNALTPWPRLEHKLLFEPWLILPDAHRTLVRAFFAAAKTPMQSGEGRVQNGECRVQSVEGRDSAGRGSELRDYVRSHFADDLGIAPASRVNEIRASLELPPMWTFDHGTGVACLFIEGIIGQHLSNFEMWCGGCNLDHVRDALHEISEDHGSGLTSLLMCIFSPGGTVTGVQETGEAIMEFAENVAPVVAFTDDLAASAAYWLAASAGEILATPSANVGSISTYSAFYDDSGYLEKLGIKREVFADGKYKAIGAQPLTDDQRAFMADRIATVGAHFKDHIRTRRPGVTDDDMQGQWWQAQDAPAALIDGLMPSAAHAAAYAATHRRRR